MNNSISILITNFNKSKFLKKSLSCVENQNYDNYEIILFDDCSTDNSIEIIKKFKKIKLIKNFKKKRSPALSQIYGIEQAFKKSKGNIICLMDADDFFKKNKLLEISKYFNENKNANILFNYLKYKKKFFLVKKKNNKYVWPTIFPTSCISIRRKAFEKFILYLSKNKFSNLEIDARIVIFSNFVLNEFNILKNNLTIYNDDPSGITAKIPKFSLTWWKRRQQAFEYLSLTMKKKKLKYTPGLDYFLTSFILFVFKKFF